MTGNIEVVIEAVFDGRSYGDFGFRKYLLHCLRHDMRSRVAKQLDRFFFVWREDFHFVAFFEWREESFSSPLITCQQPFCTDLAIALPDRHQSRPPGRSLSHPEDLREIHCLHL